MTPLNVAEFGRNAIQTAKQVLVQRVREAERDKVFKAYADKVGTLVRGVVQQVDRGNVIVKLDFSEGVLPAREQIPRSYHRPNEYVRAVVISVDRAAKGPQVTLSRTHPDFLRRLFENEVPEITDGIVEVKAVAREAGARSKISVHSTDPRVDAVGSCVGLKGSRVQGIVRELGGERIDIVPWSADPAVFVSRALAPARVNDVRVNELEKRMTVVVADDQLSLAIGKGGQNARLAARLTGWHIDLVSKTDEKQRHDVERASRLEVEQLGLGEATTEKLIQGGIETVQELVSTPFEKLVELPGIGEKTAEKVMTIALEFMAAYEAAMESATADMGFAPGMEPGEGASPDAAEGGPNG
jgi:N utilization substance protein A